jgi:RNA ligase (TIGR02306 family)
MTETRKMATIRRIDNIEPIEGADKIHTVVIGGWKVVAQKEMNYQVGDLVVYCEIDSWMPHAIAPFLTEAGKEPKVYEGVQGQRLRTKKLRGVISQGLLLPISILDDLVVSELQEGLDVSLPLGIMKWEPPAEFQAPNSKGNFPSFIPKTDQERIQNIRKFEQYRNPEIMFEVTEKLDGSSMTVFVNADNDGVCSRNLELKNEPGVTFGKLLCVMNFMLRFAVQVVI